MVLFYKRIVLSSFSKRTKRIDRKHKSLTGACPWWSYINLPQKGDDGDGSLREGTVITSQQLTASVESRGMGHAA